MQYAHFLAYWDIFALYVNTDDSEKSLNKQSAWAEWRALLTYIDILKIIYLLGAKRLR